jgi:CDP-glycerol glycerophosphotransferase (TagB/SpsB family)
MNFLLFASELYSLEIMEPLEAVIKARGYGVSWFFSKPVDAKYLDNKSVLYSVEEVKCFNPEAVFVPGNWVPDFFPGIKVQIFHGFGIEKKGHFKIRGFFDLYCTHGDLTTLPFKELAEKYRHFEVVETGWPKVDPLFKGESNSPQNQRPNILYAPTFSPSLTSAEALYDEIIKISSKGCYQWIIKFHPKMELSIVQAYKDIESEYIRVSSEPDILPLLKSSDIMLTDTSSVVYEYMLLNKPVVTYRNTNPGQHVVDFTEVQFLESVLKQAFENREKLVTQAGAISHKMHPYHDGLSSERVLNATIGFINSEHDNLSKKPINLWRKLQARKHLAYYKIK